jgi:hypothetical protein
MMLAMLAMLAGLSPREITRPLNEPPTGESVVTG